MLIPELRKVQQACGASAGPNKLEELKCYRGAPASSKQRVRAGGKTVAGSALAQCSMRGRGRGLLPTCLNAWGALSAHSLLGSNLWHGAHAHMVAGSLLQRWGSNLLRSVDVRWRVCFTVSLRGRTTANKHARGGGTSFYRVTNSSAVGTPAQERGTAVCSFCSAATHSGQVATLPETAIGTALHL